MKLTTTEDPLTEGQITTILITPRDMVQAPLSVEQRAGIELVLKSSKISDILLALQILAEQIEKGRKYERDGSQETKETCL